MSNGWWEIWKVSGLSRSTWYGSPTGPPKRWIRGSGPSWVFSLPLRRRLLERRQQALANLLQLPAAQFPNHSHLRKVPRVYCRNRLQRTVGAEYSGRNIVAGGQRVAGPLEPLQPCLVGSI